MGAGRYWTQAEKDQLAEEWGRYSIDTIGKHLGRSRYAIMEKASRLGLGAHLSASSLISFNVLINELGLKGGYEWHLEKLTKAGLKIHEQRVKDCSFRMVDLNEFWKFAEQNRYFFDFSRLEENALGKEPSWVKVKRSEDFKRSRVVKPNKTQWTKAEDKELLRLLRTFRYTWLEIADKLHRSEGAIQRRLQDLGIKERPLKADNRSVWTDEQIQTLCRMIKQGSNYEVMSRTIGKSAKAIRGKVFTVYLTESLQKVSKMLGDGEWGDNRPEKRIVQKNLMSAEEKNEVKTGISKLAGLLAYKIRKPFEDQDNWQRLLCQHWDERKGCTAGETNCDDCPQFLRLQPKHCIRCGSSFYDRQSNRMCERCRVQRKKSGYVKYLRRTGVIK